MLAELVGRLVDEPDAVGDREVLWTVPAGIIELKHDDAVAPGAGLACKGVEQLAKQGLSIPFDRYQTVTPMEKCSSLDGYFDTRNRGVMGMSAQITCEERNV
jgi:hypothetical protein